MNLYLKRFAPSGFTVSSVMFILLACVYVALRVWRLGEDGLWFDEVFSIEAARRDWSELISFVAWDVVHPPLFYLLLKVWRAVGGEAVWWLALFPVATSIVALVPFTLLCRELRLSDAEINTTLALLAVNGYLIYYAQELRMYGLLLLLTLCSLWLFACFMNRADDGRKLLATLFVVNLLLVYTQYFGWLIVGIEAACVWWWKRERFVSFAGWIAGTVICFMPWAYVVGRALIEKRGMAANLAWVTRPTLSDVAWHFAVLHGAFDVRRTTSLGMMLFGVPVVVWAWRVVKGDDKAGRQVFWMLALPAFVPVMIAFCASYLLTQSVWGGRHLIIVAVSYLILVATAAHRVRPKTMRVVAVSAVVMWATLASITTLAHNDARIPWNSLLETMRRNEAARDEGTKVYAMEEFVAAPVRFNLSAMGERRFQIMVVDNLDAMRGEHFWVVYRYTMKDTPKPTPADVLSSEGYQVEHKTIVGNLENGVTLFAVRRAS